MRLHSALAIIECAKLMNNIKLDLLLCSSFFFGLAYDIFKGIIRKAMELNSGPECKQCEGYNDIKSGLLSAQITAPLKSS